MERHATIRALTRLSGDLPEPLNGDIAVIVTTEKTRRTSDDDLVQVTQTITDIEFLTNVPPAEQTVVSDLVGVGTTETWTYPLDDDHYRGERSSQGIPPSSNGTYGATPNGGEPPMSPTTLRCSSRSSISTEPTFSPPPNAQPHSTCSPASPNSQLQPTGDRFTSKRNTSPPTVTSNWQPHSTTSASWSPRHTSMPMGYRLTPTDQ